MGTEGLHVRVDALPSNNNRQLVDSTTIRAVWTDASHWRGGHTWAWVDDSGHFAHGRGMGFAIDNNEAELWAVAEALRTVPTGHVVHVNTDSVAAAALMRPFASVDEVPANAKRDAASLYRECLEEVDLVTAGKTVVVHWLKGHRSSGWNVAADRLATAARWEDTTLNDWMQDCENALRALNGQQNSAPACSCGPLPLRVQRSAARGSRSRVDV